MELIYVTVLLVIIGLFFVWWKKQHNSAIEWTIVRPDDLINNEEISAYEVYASLTRSAVFNAE